MFAIGNLIYGILLLTVLMPPKALRLRTWAAVGSFLISGSWYAMMAINALGPEDPPFFGTKVGYFLWCGAYLLLVLAYLKKTGAQADGLHRLGQRQRTISP